MIRGEDASRKMVGVSESAPGALSREDDICTRWRNGRPEGAGRLLEGYRLTEEGHRGSRRAQGMGKGTRRTPPGRIVPTLKILNAEDAGAQRKR